MKLALVADWLPTFAGAEHVIAECCTMWPDAPLYTTVAAHGKLGPLDAQKISTTPLQKWYSVMRNHKVLLPWMPRALENIDLSAYDVVVSSSHAVGKGIVPPSTAVHICYCHTPMRYAWEMEDMYLLDFGVPRILRKTVKQFLKRIRRWDLTTAKRVDVFIANSTTTQERIKRIYDRESIVIHPPVSERFFKTRETEPQNKPYFLAIGRLVPYKKFDLLIEAANASGFSLKIAGTGDDFSRLKAMAGPTVEMLGFVEDAELPRLYTNAKALLFPQFEDAGVVPLEAQACGTPVIAYGLGGVLDTVRDGRTGVFFPEQTIASLTDAIDRFASMHFDSEAITQHAKQFSSTNFQQKLQEVVDQHT
ncbi:MAG: glycosyltransferase [bacterium]|nr:glycosyltransferase [bacterium]